VPIATASASTPVAATNSAAWSGSVRSCPSAPCPSSASPWPLSSEPRQPSSPSTETPTAWASSQTWRVTLTLYSKLAGVFASSSSEPSIITLVKPCWIAERQVAGPLPWSWCRQTGICGQVSTAASTIRRSMKSPAYVRAPRLAWTITGASVLAAAFMIASSCSMLLMLNAGTP
jgi:hypothetical protein